MLSDLPFLLAAIAFAAIILSLAEWNHRHDMRKLCMCSHPKGEHDTYLGKCDYHTVTGGYLYSCPCSEFRYFTELVL